MSQSTITTAAQTSTIIGGGDVPGESPVQLGAITFNTGEAPERLPIGVEQMMVSKTLAGGSRVVQTFGVDPEDITWSGKLYGSFIAARIAQIRLYGSSGNPVKLSWIRSNSSATGPTLKNGASMPLSQIKEVYSVIVKSFKPEYMAHYVDYSISLVVVAAKNGAYASSVTNNIDTQINALQIQANNLTQSLNMAAGTQAAAIVSAMNVVNADVKAASPISQNPLSAQSIQQDIQTAQTAISSFNALQSAGSNSLATALQLSGTLSALSKNIAAGYAPNSVTKQGGNAFTVASQYYGDVSQAFTLVGVAGLPSVFLPGGPFSTLFLPNLGTPPFTNKNQAA